MAAGVPGVVPTAVICTSAPASSSPRMIMWARCAGDALGAALHPQGEHRLDGEVAARCSVSRAARHLTHEPDPLAWIGPHRERRDRLVGAIGKELPARSARTEVGHRNGEVDASI